MEINYTLEHSLLDGEPNKKHGSNILHNGKKVGYLNIAAKNKRQKKTSY